MKILIVSSTPTHPVISGNRKGILEQVNLFRLLGHDVYFLYIERRFIHPNPDFQNALADMKAYWGDHLIVYKESCTQKLHELVLSRYRHLTGGFNKCDDFYPYNLHNRINVLNDKYKFDACVVNYYFLTKAFDKINIPRKALFTHDSFSYKNLLTGKKNVAFNLTADEEAKAMQRSPHIFAVNDAEAIFFQRLSPKSVLHTIYFRIEHVPQKACLNHNILFLSGYNEFNQNGLTWFLDDIFPLIKKKFNDAKLLIGGSICDVLSELRNRDDIDLVGRVNNIDVFYSKGDVAINPTYQGTGIKIKTIESIAFDKATFVHPHSKDGVYMPDIIPVFASKNPDEWVKRLETIWNNPPELVEIKKRNQYYIDDMNNHIREEYISFLK